ncbi:helix-turn-helix transcriptional regulator [Novosphingobium mangrovi (ex Huang et al. 2023)]|uniref:Helix-turn-helix transcriptional regulator n=1 Tax=Novosphingobium mangrovi (ex Huang et al. 2023) TaxID=2976432 RepID=A0ABT2I8B1_9SPHN|nr:helix-turn-helix transcriptional regulator [Novosphingobium mangrovi (ex Huang et al. 2023)]MCT2401058.1 helix-turn-helix transcriptional regulator [Novosphingobium mangrovi (ex Huang et al. 2023)]
MALTSRDETDLLLPLFRGLSGNEGFSAFLETLRRRTRAEYIGLIQRTGNGAHARIHEYHAGIDLRARAQQSDPLDAHALDRFHYDGLRPGRVYSIAEFTDHDPVFRIERAQRMQRLGIADERVVRIADIGDVSTWLIMARARSCSAADSALLSNLAPYVEEALKARVELEKNRVRASVSVQGLARSATAWMVLDRDARLLSIDPRLDTWMQETLGYRPRIGERLRDLGVQAERELMAAAAHFTSDEPGSPRPLLLFDDPRLEALLTSTTDMPQRSMLVLCRLPNARTKESVERLAHLFDLPRREAELAVALNKGLSIAEAAESMGLTLETARNYSKRLYAKLGVRGQAELVRLVSDSVAVMA